MAERVQNHDNNARRHSLGSVFEINGRSVIVQRPAARHDNP